MEIGVHAAAAFVILASLHFASTRNFKVLCVFLACLSVLTPFLFELWEKKSFALINWVIPGSAAMTFGFLFWEQLSPRVQYGWSGRQFVKNVNYSHLRPLAYSVFSIYLVRPAAHLTPKLWSMDQHHLPIWAQFIVLVLVFDFLEYVWHRMFHWFDVTWRFHKVHHGSEQLNVFARESCNVFGTFGLRLLSNVILAALLGASIEAYILTLALNNLISSHFAHANVDVPRLDKKLPLWAYIFNSPNLHAHHHTVAGARSNFGQNFIFWDWLFGTLEVPVETPKVFGNGDKRFTDQSIWADQFSPFFADGPVAGVETPADALG